MSLCITQPTTAEEVEAFRADIEALYQHSPNPLDTFIDDVKEYPEYLTFITEGDTLAAMIEIKDDRWFPTLGKHSLMFGGVIHPDFRDTPIITEIAPAVIRSAFRSTRKRKMLAATTDDNKPAQHALSALGFKRIGRDPEKRILYKLERKHA